ncbi:MAG: DUF115 domain-containing protein [Candidatus Zophobacter franzmannii]|nr:DUF115 domain-containing protein [Candidatus Zophobacter franzmannii]
MTEFNSKEQYTFKRNLKAIQQSQPSMVALIKRSKRDTNLIVEENANKQNIFSYKVDDGVIRLSATTDPEKYAKRIVEEDFRFREASSEKSTVGVAFALDRYIIQATASFYDWYRYLFFVFPSLDYLYTVLHYMDFRDQVADGTFGPLSSDSNDAVIKTLSANLIQTEYQYNGLQLFTYYPYSLVNKELLQGCLRQIDEDMLMMSSNIATMMNRSEMMVRNEILNMRYLHKHPSVSVLKDKVKDKPIISVSAGPSLAKNIEFLKKIQNEVYIIAVARVARKLIEEGIMPDMLTVIDMSELTEAYFKLEDIVVLSKIPVVMEFTTTYKVMKEHDAKYIFSFHGLRGKKYLRRYFAKLGLDPTVDSALDIGGTVAITSLFAAKRLGAKEVILLGQDLAFGDTTHIDDHSTNQKINEIKEIGGQEYFVSGEEDGHKTLTPAIRIKGYYGDDVYTTPSFQTFKVHFEGAQKQDPSVSIVNATEGGAFIEGLEHISLEEAYKKYIKENKLKNKQDIVLYDDSDIKIAESSDIVESIKETITRYEEIMSEFESIREALAALLKMLYNSGEIVKIKEKELNARLADLLENYGEELSAVIESGVSGGLFFFKLLQNANSRKFSEKRKDKDEIDRVDMFLHATVEALKMHTEELEVVGSYYADLKETA